MIYKNKVKYNKVRYTYVEEHKVSVPWSFFVIFTIDVLRIDPFHLENSVILYFNYKKGSRNREWSFFPSHF